MTAKETLISISNSFISEKIKPVAIWSERTYPQDDMTGDFFYETRWGNKEQEKLFGKVWDTVFEMFHSFDIYLNHIVLEFLIDGETIYLGVNDNRLSISKKVATIGGTRYEVDM